MKQMMDRAETMLLESDPEIGIGIGTIQTGTVKVSGGMPPAIAMTVGERDTGNVMTTQTVENMTEATILEVEVADHLEAVSGEITMTGGMTIVAVGIAMETGMPTVRTDTRGGMKGVRTEVLSRGPS